MSRLERTELFLGKDSLEKLKNARVAVIGLGGVGGSAAEAVLRAGVGHLLFVDGDTVDETNLNRQLLATYETVGLDKVEAARLRFEKIAPDCDITYKKEFYLPENSDFLYDWKPDYIIDAIDTVTAKLHMAEECKKRGIKLLMCLGTGNRLDPEKLKIGDIYKTDTCPLCRVLRTELKKKNIKKLDVIWSDEKPIEPESISEDKKKTVASVPFVPGTAGLMAAAFAVRKLLEI